MFYTGVGSRSTPSDMLEIIADLGLRLDRRGFKLRSGHAVGADRAFESKIALTGCEIYLADNKELIPDDPSYVYPCEISDDLWEQAESIAKSIHPNWNAPAMTNWNNLGQRLHTRNIFQVLGLDLDTPSKFLVCWAPWKVKGTSVEGGTNTALQVALLNTIPIFNLIDGQVAADNLTKLVLELTNG